MFRKEEIKLLWPFYLEAFLGTALFVMIPFIVLYFSSIGFSSSQIGILIAVTSLASLIFEIPTGAIADLYGRKFSVILGWIIHGLCLIIIFFSRDYYILLLIFFIIGIAQTLTSGSYEAWVVDLLKDNKKKGFILSYFANRQSLVNLGFVLSGVIGAFFVAKFGIRIIWILSGIALLMSGLFLFFGKSEKQKTSELSVYKQVKGSVKYGFKHNVIFYLLLVTFIWGVSDTLNGVISWTPLLKSYNLQDYAFGYLWSASGLIGVIAPLLARKFSKNRKEKSSLILIASFSLLYGALILIAGNLSFFIFLYIFSFFLLDFKVPVWNSYFHRFIPGKLRATTTSIQNMIFSLAGIIFLPLAGFLVDKIGARYTIFISALLAVPVVILYSKIREEI